MAQVPTPLGVLEFGEYNMAGEWNACPGVYMFVRRQANGSFDILYVGLCDSFKGRMCGHERWPDALALGATEVHAIPISQR